MDASTEVRHQADMPTRPRAAGLRIDRIVVGLFVIGVGIAWFLDLVGVSVPWRLFPAIGLMFVGLALLVSLLGMGGRGGLIGLGVLLGVLALAVAAQPGRFVGPVGDRTVTPTQAEWPVSESVSAGTLTIDLTRYPLPRTGRLEASVGAGRIVITRPEDASTRVIARVGVGDIKVNGDEVSSGMGADWTERAPGGPAVVLDLQVGTGSIEVNDE